MHVVATCIVWPSLLSGIRKGNDGVYYNFEDFHTEIDCDLNFHHDNELNQGLGQ